MTDPRRSLPGVDRVLAEPALEAALAAWPRSVVVTAARAAIAEARLALATPDSPPDAPTGATPASALAERAAQLAAEQSRPTLRPVINATGVILHTNLGRAPLADVALERMAQAAQGYANLEFDLDEGVRGSRYTHCAGLLCELTGAEAAVVVNNAAAALILCLNTVARGEGVVVSRGELIEIGGGFRIPEIVERAETRLLEVGTTNRTRLDDYRTENNSAAALLKVHRSNFRLEGFSEEVDVPALRDLGAELGIPLVYDLGSGLMQPLDAEGLPSEPTVPDAVKAGADLVIFSGDKLLGGPQAGVVLGSRKWIASVRKNPLTRALRVDGLTLAALEATLELYRRPSAARTHIPVLRMIHTPAAELKGRGERLVAQLNEVSGDPNTRFTVEACESVVGGGTLPGAKLPSWAVRVEAGAQAGFVAKALRTAESPAVVARVQEGAVLVDLRTVEPKNDGLLLHSLARCVR